MNNFHSGSETYYPRWLTPLLREATQEYPVVVLTGARQVGKSTLLRQADPFRGWRYHSLDDFDVANQAARDPAALWSGSDRIILDEVQKAPHLLPAIKLAVDASPARRFVLSGSANLMLMQRVSESLAGRAVYMVLAPMTLGELHLKSPPMVLTDLLQGRLPPEGYWPEGQTDPAEVLSRGLLPSLIRLATQSACTRWWDGYVATYLERDLRQLSQVSNLLDFRRMMSVLALRTAQVLNQSDVARDVGLSGPTLHRYLNLLETTHLFGRLPAYLSNRTSRLVKAPKAFWTDPGLAAFLSGYYAAGDLRNSREYGAFFETLIHHHLQVLASLMTPSARVYYWRTRAGAEVDFVVEHGQRLVAVEVKLTVRPRYEDCSGLTRFLDLHPSASAGVFLHGGDEIRRMGEKIIALPWSMLTG